MTKAPVASPESEPGRLDADIAAGLAALAAEMPRCDAERHGAELYGAPRFSVFSLFGDKETTLSRILADLFDPNGIHGQGALFLNALLDMADIHRASRNDRAVNVRTEAPIAATEHTTHRRIDILIETASELIGIENKKWTGEGTNQLQDYWRDIKRRADAVGKRSYLLFVSNDAPTESAALQIPYFSSAGRGPSIELLLATAKPKIRAPRIRDFIDDFHNWIGRTFSNEPWGQRMQANAEIIIEGLADRQKAQAIGSALLCAEDVRKCLVDDFQRFVESRLTNFFGADALHFDEHTLYSALQSTYGKWSFRHIEWPAKCWLSIECQNPQATNINYGLLALRPGSPPSTNNLFASSICEEIAMVDNAVSCACVEAARSSAWWPWYRSAPQRDWSTRSFGEALIANPEKVADWFGIDRVCSDFAALTTALIDASKPKVVMGQAGV